MKAIVVDDERLARKELKDLLQKDGRVEILDEASNAEEAKEKIVEHKPDLIFLDIQMPGKNGFELLEDLEMVPRVIFISAYDEYAIKAFEVNALDYLLKPIESDRLKEAIDKVIADLQDDPSKEEQGELSANDRIFLKDGEKCWFVPMKDIRLFEAEGNYIRVYFNNDKPLILRSLNNLEKRLDDKLFFRASRKHIVNLHWIEDIEPWFNGRLMAKLTNGEEVEISRRQATRFKEKMSL